MTKKDLCKAMTNHRGRCTRKAVLSGYCIMHYYKFGDVKDDRKEEEKVTYRRANGMM